MGGPDSSSPGSGPGVPVGDPAAGRRAAAEAGRTRRRCTVLILAALGVAVADGARADNLRAAAAALAMSAFVGRSCPKLKPNFPAIHDLFKRAGFDTPEPPPPLIAEAGSIQADLKRMPTDKACSQLWDHFGADGTSAPGLLEAAPLPP